MKEKRHMTCAVCGSYAGRWVQWHNRDTGYGLCRDCVEWLRSDRGMSESEVKDLYGIEGVNYAPAVDVVEVEATLP